MEIGFHNTMSQMLQGIRTLTLTLLDTVREGVTSELGLLEQVFLQVEKKDILVRHRRRSIREPCTAGRMH